MRTVIVIPAAGYGRLNGADSGSKLLAPLGTHNGQPLPLIAATIHSVLHLDLPVVVVVNPENQQAIEGVLADHHLSTVKVVTQPDRHGTADAIRRALDYPCAVHAETVITVCGDMPCWRAATITRLLAAHEGSPWPLSLVVVPLWGAVPDMVRHYGRLVYDGDRIVDVVNGGPHDIGRVSPSLFAIDVEWFRRIWEGITPLDKGDGRKPEQHLSGLIPLAVRDGGVIEIELTDPREAIGINTLRDLALAQHVVRQHA